MLINASCKKSESVIDINTNKAIPTNITKQIAMDLYRSLSSGVSTSANGGVKTGSTSTLKTLDNEHACGQLVKSATDKTVTSGDTTRNITDRTAFTYLCNGYFNNNYNIDAYNLKDTLTITDTGSGFKNVNGVTLNYTVKSTDYWYTHVSISGFTNTSVYVSKVSAGVTTEAHRIATGYTWDDVYAKRAIDSNNAYHDDQQPTFLSGRVQFSTFIVDNVNNNNPGFQPTGAYSGYMTFLADNMVKVSFYMKDNNGTKDYLLNFVTGKVTEL